MRNEMITPRTLFAMHPEALTELIQRATIEARVPDWLQNGFFGQVGGNEAAKPVDPIREGSVAIVPLTGTLSPSGSYGPRGNTERFSELIRDLASDKRVGAIVIKIQSPGGLVWGTKEAGDAVYEARQAKPIVAIADKYAFSAAHWIATQASAFYVTGSGQVGSVGVRGGHIDMSGLEEKIGLKTTLIASDAKKIAAHPYAPLSDDDRAEIQAEVDEMNLAFVSAIARGRGIKASEVSDIHGRGEIFSAKTSCVAGICDGEMTLREVVAKYSSSRSRLALMKRRASLQRQILEI